MKWIDYREKLGIGFSDESKGKLLARKIATFISRGALNEKYSYSDYYRFCLMTGINSKIDYSITNRLENLFLNDKLTLPKTISYYIAFVNTQTECKQEHREVLISVLEEFLDDLNIAYEVIWDDDGAFVFPKGVKEFDDALVSEVLDWLKNYPQAEKAWIKALREYSQKNTQNASDVADKFRKALETFFKEFFGNDKTLENNKAEYGRYLKSQGVPAEISNNLETLLQAYTHFMNGYAKHHDKTETKVLEYLMYQTGNIMRLLITLKTEAESNAN